MSAAIHGNPGEWAKVKGTVASMWPLFVCFAALGALGAAAAIGRHVVWFSVAFLAAVGVTAFLWRKGLRRVESYFKGARGEERVAGILATLPDGWNVFHDLVAQGLHVDHVVAGPAGVFAVETKNWRGRVTVEDGEVLVGGVLPDRAPVVQAMREADAVKAALKKMGWEGDVTPVLCMASDTCSAPEAEVRRVALLNSSAVVKWLVGKPTVIPPNELARLSQLMETCL